MSAAFNRLMFNTVRDQAQMSCFYCLKSLHVGVSKTRSTDRVIKRPRLVTVRKHGCCPGWCRSLTCVRASLWGENGVGGAELCDTTRSIHRGIGLSLMQFILHIM